MNHFFDATNRIPFVMYMALSLSIALLALLLTFRMQRRRDIASGRIASCQWVSCGDRFPPVNSEGWARVLPVEDAEGNISFCTFRRSPLGGEYWIGNYERNVIRWFDLPAPPGYTSKT